MCYTCGCNMPYNDMGDKTNITEDYFEKAGQTEAIGKEGKVKAKKNMIALLQKEVDKEELEKPRSQYPA